jgi:hypothetical protein
MRETVPSHSIEVVVAEFTQVLEHDGLHAALALLNARTRHRFTGVYRFDPPMLRAVSLFDRENPTLRLGGDTPMRETYCLFVGEAGAPFATDDAACDTRLIAHPARASVIPYCGVPLRSERGTCFGTLCHFDMRPRLAPVAELLLLEGIAPVVARAVTRAVRPSPIGPRAVDRRGRLGSCGR